MSNTKQLLDWARYYRRNAEAIRNVNPGISAAVLRVAMHRDYGKSLVLDAVIDRLYEVG